MNMHHRIGDSAHPIVATTKRQARARSIMAEAAAAALVLAGFLVFALGIIAIRIAAYVPWHMP